MRYVRIDARRTIGAKREIACEHARGEIIAHWDDDDWYGPSRLREQLAPIIANEADITGLAATSVHDIASDQFWTLTRDLHRRAFIGDVHGGTQRRICSSTRVTRRTPGAPLCRDFRCPADWRRIDAPKTFGGM